MGAGKSRHIRVQICKMLYDYTIRDIPAFPEGWADIAGQIMKLFPKPEATILYKEETEIFKIPYYKCRKCGYVIECGSGIIDHYKFCPVCGRRIMAMEDKTICQ